MTRYNQPISDSATDRLLAIDGVVSVGVGLDRGERAIIVGIEDDSVRSQLPGQVEGFPVVTEVEDRPGVAAAQPPLADDRPPENLPRPVAPEAAFRHRPVRPGVSIGHESITAGTAGFFATDGGSLYQLSNSHVLALYGEADIGDNVLQPGPLDGGMAGEDTVGGLSGHVPVSAEDNLVDLAWYEPTVEADDDIFQAGVPGSGSVSPEVGDEVTFVGRSSGRTSVTVDRTHMAVEVGESRRIFTDQFRTQTAPIPGDSGAPILQEVDGNLRPAGMVFAASDRYGYCNYISNVEAESGLTVLNTTDVGDGGGTGQPQQGSFGSKKALAALALVGGTAWYLSGGGSGTR